jgi:hypothetical protein
MFEKLISRIGSLLSKHQVPYMIIGGQTVLLYGLPRLTEDIDITLGVPVERLSDIITICKTSRLKILPNDYKKFVAKTYVLPVKDEISEIRVDLIFSFTPYEQQAIKRSKKVKICNKFVNFASVEDVVIHKLFAGRPRDIEDARNIIVKTPLLDRKYINCWLKEFDKATEARKFTDSFKQVLKEAK